MCQAARTENAETLIHDIPPHTHLNHSQASALLTYGRGANDVLDRSAAKMLLPVLIPSFDLLLVPHKYFFLMEA
jgi:hypothetical protein